MSAEAVKLFIRDNATDILKWGAVVGVAANSIISYRQGTKAAELVRKAKEEKGEKLTKKEYLKVTWKNYIPIALTGGITVACILGGDHVHVKRNAALSAAYAMSQTALQNFAQRTAEKLGERKTQAIKDEVVKDIVDKNPVTNREVIITGKGTTLFYDTMSGRYFESDIDKIKKAINELNRDMIDEMYVSLNDFYYAIGLKGVEIGSLLGWNVGEEGLIDVGFSAQIADDERPCLALTYNVSPRENYGTLH